MHEHLVCRSTCVLLAALLPAAAYGQSVTYHLHKEGTKSTFQLKTSGPDAVATTITLDLKNQPAGEYAVKAFDTSAGSPGAAGIVPAGSIVRVVVWMRKTTSAGTMYPRARLRLNSAVGPTLCTATGASPLTTSTVSYSLSCTTSANLTMSATDRFYLWTGVSVTAAPGNTAVKAELHIEGTLNGNYDSQVTAPLSIQRPVITEVAPASGSPGTAVIVSGSGFGAAQGSSTVTFNGTAATAGAWTATTIATSVPAGATSGPFVVTVRGLTSNAVPFTVTIPYSIAGIVSRATGGMPIPGATVVAASMGTTVAAATTAADGSYGIADLDLGVYDLTVSAQGFADEWRSGVTVAPMTTAVIDVGMVVPGWLTGRVTTADGSTPIPGATIRTIAGSLDAGAATTDASGAYRVPSLRPGAFTVLASSVGNRTAERTALVAENAPTSIDFALDVQPPGPVSYVYDAVGRLVQVTDANGDFAVYYYDAVGNVLAIDRPAAGGVSISGITPGTGGVGDLVTIFGGGFEAAGPNEVTFNGAAAIVESASSTQLLTRVPAGATSGPVGVTTPAGTALSAMPFVVAANGGRPLITALNPTIGVTGTPIGIAGVNFDASAINDRADLNGRVTSIAAASTTVLTTSVPPFAMGGRVTVTTPLGRAVSDADFVVVPAPYGPGDVEVSDRFAIGAARTIAINTPNKIGLLLFDGVSGQRVSFVVTSSSIGGGTIAIYRPDAVQMAGASTIGTNTFIDSQILPITGTYTIALDPAGAATGSLTLTSYEVRDVEGSISANGPGVPVSIVAPGQNAFLSFGGAAGQLVSVTATSSVWTSCQFGGQYSLAILKPDGSLLGNATNACGATTILERQTLPVAGTYFVRLDPYGTNTGDATLALYAFADVTAPIVAGGPSVPVAITAPGQVALLTFSGIAGQSISASSTSSTWTSCQFGGQYSFGVQKPDGSLLVLATNACGATTFLDRVTLPVTGTYAVKVDPYGAITGSATVTLYDVVDVSGPIALDGTSVTVPITAPSQNGLLTFTGAAGQVVSAFAATPWTGCIDSPHFYLRLLAPNGSAVSTSYDSCSGGTAFTDQVTLPASGSYTLMLDPIGTWTGTASVAAYTFTDITGPIVPNGPAVPVTIAMPGQNARLTFAGTAGQIVNASASTPWTGCIDSPHFYLKLVAPDGSALTTTYDACTGGHASTGPITLAVSGTYTVVLDPLWTRTGGATVALTSP